MRKAAEDAISEAICDPASSQKIAGRHRRECFRCLMGWVLRDGDHRVDEARREARRAAFEEAIAAVNAACGIASIDMTASQRGPKR